MFFDQNFDQNVNTIQNNIISQNGKNDLIYTSNSMEIDNLTKNEKTK